jgi:hypothetical protein
MSIKGIWRKIVRDAQERVLFRNLAEKLFSEALKILELNDEDSCIDKFAFPEEKLFRVSLHLDVKPLI